MDVGVRDVLIVTMLSHSNLIKLQHFQFLSDSYDIRERSIENLYLYMMEVSTR